MKLIVNKVVFKTPLLLPFEHICFIDTSGFNPGTNAEFDRNTAISAISNASALLWCFDVTGGTIPDDEIDILQGILDKNPNLKLYFVANKADLKSAEENQDVLEEVKGKLQDFYIPYEGISLYNSRQKITEQAEKYTVFAGKHSLINFLNECNAENNQKEACLLEKVRQVFSDYAEADAAKKKIKI